MAWLKGNLSFGQFIVLALLVAALLGPWLIGDRINVPAQYTCDPPWLRLEGDFCGMPISGLGALWFVVTALFSLLGQVFSGSVYPRDVQAVLIIVAWSTLLLLPYALTIARLVTGNRRPGRKFALVAWGLAAAAGGLLILFATEFRQPFYLMWGIWLLTGLALVMLVVEARQSGTTRDAGPLPQNA